jgi:heme exporter protein C
MKSGITIAALATLILLSYALHQAMIKAPTEATMGEVQRIFYYHVPSAITGFTCFFVTFVASLVYLAGRDRRSDALAVSTAEVGVVFTTVVLITGPLWAKPVWGIWWTWDARLTSTLVLWLIFVSYLLLRRFALAGQGSVLAAVLAVVGFLDVPFVYFSIRWFRTQHPQPITEIDPAMRLALYANFAAFFAFAALLVFLRYRLERLRQQVEEAHATQALVATAESVR